MLFYNPKFGEKIKKLQEEIDFLYLMERCRLLEKRFEGTGLEYINRDMINGPKGPELKHHLWVNGVGAFYYDTVDNLNASLEKLDTFQKGKADGIMATEKKFIVQPSVAPTGAAN